MIDCMNGYIDNHDPQLDPAVQTRAENEYYVGTLLARNDVEREIAQNLRRGGVYSDNS